MPEFFALQFDTPDDAIKAAKRFGTVSFYEGRRESGKDAWMLVHVPAVRDAPEINVANLVTLWGCPDFDDLLRSYAQYRGAMTHQFPTTR
jgi:hypothetical protein